ncbi:MAG: UPF0280 family protein [Deltaproteobacteria bacterium]|nr:MAG: UPF0280 family protein [Deltaproteobacteria bacterium]
MNEYRERRYRYQVRHDRLVAFEVVVQETDLLILADSNLARLAEEVVYRVRGPLEGYIVQNPDFLYAMTPLSQDQLAPRVVREMLTAASKCGTGPMASVAGAIAEQVGLALLQESNEIVVENGGDCFVKVETPLQIGIFAGRSGLSHRLALRIQPAQTPVGVCTSSGTVGHSLSFGRADAVTIIAPSAALADAAATMTCNQVQNQDDIQRAISFAREIEGVVGVVIIMGDQIGAWGEVELVPMTAS